MKYTTKQYRMIFLVFWGISLVLMSFIAGDSFVVLCPGSVLFALAMFYMFLVGVARNPD